MTQRKKRIAIVCISALLVLAAISVFVFGFMLPRRNAENTIMPADGTFTAQMLEDGTLSLSWTAAEGADGYLLEILPTGQDGASKDTTPLYRITTEENQCVVPALDDVDTCVLRVTSFVNYRTPVGLRHRIGEEPLEMTVDLETPAVSDLTWNIDEASNTLHLSFDMAQGDVCSVSLLEDGGSAQTLAVLEEGKLSISFGEGQDLPLPEVGQPYTLGLCVKRERDGFCFYGPVSATLTVSREDLLGWDLAAEITGEGDNVYTITWQEIKGDRYEIQCLDAETGEWVEVTTVAAGETCAYTTPHLDPFCQYSYRIVVFGGALEDGESIISEALICETEASAIYCTVWPVSDLPAYSDSEMTEEIGTVEAMQAYCVLEQTDGAFGVWSDGQLCYISSDYCMINLPEYIGSLCSYQITNSVDSLYMVHEFEIPDVTGTVITGYENVMLADGEYLVPLLYPAAQKLVTAAQNALSQGYRLKIYDSFRPNKATLELYDIASALLDCELPAATYTGVSLDSLNLPDPTIVTETAEDGTEIVTETPLTYRDIMLGGYSLNAFLARGRSMHNLGIALDLTLEDAATGTELEMQTSIHDLSHYSALSENNSNADTLAAIMTSAGFGALSSEWWHFQDNEARDGLSLTTVSDGVSVEGWTADDNGWRYRDVDGSYYTDCAATIAGVAYVFDCDGYVASD